MKKIQTSCLIIIFLFACSSQFYAMNCKQLSHYDGRVWSVTFSPSGKYFAASSAETRLTIYDKSFNVLFQTDDLIKEVSAIEFSPDEKYLAIPKYKNETDVGLIDLNHFQVYHILSGHTDWVTCVDFSSDGMIVATGSDDKSVRTWKRIGQSFMFHQLITGHGGSIANLCFSQNSQFLAVCGNNIIRIYKKAYDQYILYQTITTDARFVNGLAFNPKDHSLAIGTYDGTILIYQNKGSQFILKHQMQAHQKMVHSIDFTPDGQYMATGSWDSQICLWGQLQSNLLKMGQLTGHKKQVYDIAFHPDGQCLASGSEDNTVLIWDIQLNHKGMLEK
ncbi:MAG: WD-40 repeat protein [Candidatus Magnetoglobus multicellularis str. Araruama]|uniref:WD-40 repeat protein n=1 Tax=Candidatus Magnetoglobus multicellularis str. Araruama TaxID=890399 RepID=A0A1V1PFJ7_9BACT|nr:MAG: WD-40 repeat protein [Candidatus Magnetoglobus multicellularis str. Araruama]